MVRVVRLSFSRLRQVEALEMALEKTISC
jgi:hypothetical protein